MTSEEIQPLIVDILNFCLFTEVPRFVDNDGSLQYRDDISYGKSRLSYKFIEDGIQVCDSTGQWYELEPLRSLDHCAYLISRLSLILHQKSQYPNSHAEVQLLNDLHADLIRNVLELMKTLNKETILDALERFFKNAKKSIDSFKDRGGE